MNSLFTRILPLVLIIGLAVTLSSCGHPDPYVRRGRAGGAVLGAVAGAIIGNNVRGISRGEGAIAGAVLGGILGDARGRANSAYYGHRYRRPYYY